MIDYKLGYEVRGRMIDAMEETVEELVQELAQLRKWSDAAHEVIQQGMMLMPRAQLRHWRGCGEVEGVYQSIIDGTYGGDDE